MSLFPIDASKEDTKPSDAGQGGAVLVTEKPCKKPRIWVVLATWVIRSGKRHFQSDLLVGNAI